jgi:hypothetical protein
MYICDRSIDFASVLAIFSIRFRNCSDNVVFFIPLYHILSTKERKFAYIILKEYYDCICLP